MDVTLQVRRILPNINRSLVFIDVEGVIYVYREVTPEEPLSMLNIEKDDTNK